MPVKGAKHIAMPVVFSVITNMVTFVPLFFPLNILEKWQKRFSAGFEGFVKNIYGRVLSRLLAYRYTVIALGVALLMITAGYTASWKMGMVIWDIHPGG